MWHATCGEIAAYFRTRESTRVHVHGDRAFEVRRPAAEGPWAPLSLALSGCALPDAFALRGPRGDLAARVSRRTGAHGCVLAPIALEPGSYEIA